jgi:hypothetical protein
MHTTVPRIQIEVSPGELLDRLSILALKVAHVADPARRGPLQAQQAALQLVRAQRLPALPALAALEAELAAINGALWAVEDALRALEAASRFDAEFVALARSVYRQNDRRAAVKRAIDTLLGSHLLEEKVYST